MPQDVDCMPQTTEGLISLEEAAERYKGVHCPLVASAVPPSSRVMIGRECTGLRNTMCHKMWLLSLAGVVPPRGNARFFWRKRGKVLWRLPPVEFRYDGLYEIKWVPLRRIIHNHPTPE